MSKQTAIDWIVEQVNSDCLNAVYIRPELILQAKAMEKERITEAHLQGLYSEIKMRGEAQAEQYYNETYGGDK
jgi:hypothetical protein